MKPINSAARNAEALVDMLENILVSYQDSDSRPERSLMLYRKWLQLGAKYRVRLAKGLVVIEGGAKFELPLHRRCRRGFAKAHLKLIPRAMPL
jgi:hypothetical protein